jgi:uncharacterized membrane protein
LLPETAEALRQIGIDTPEKAAHFFALTASVSRSPFPSPEMLRAYDNYRPGTGAEIMDWLKEQTHHRQALERKRTDGSEKRLDRAQSNSLVVALFGLVIAAATAHWSSTAAAIVFAAVSVGGPPVATVVARLLDRPEKKS